MRHRDDLESRSLTTRPDIVTRLLTSMTRTNEVAAKHRHGLHDALAQSHGVLASELRVSGTAPAPYRQGL